MIDVKGLVRNGTILLLFYNHMTVSFGADEFSHELWSDVLSRYVDDDGMVAYEDLAANRFALDQYLDSIREAGPDTRPEIFGNREAELAYYINAYNALIFEGVLARGPEQTSVWRGLVSGYGFFVRMKVELDGATTNLKSLEDDIIREKFGDPRIHAALNCASMGCPRLPREVFNAEWLDRQLDAAMREFVTDPRHVRVDAAGGIVHLSRIFDWFESDFIEYEELRGNADAVLLDYINRYRGADARIAREMKIKFLKYDKGINSRK